MEQTLAPLPQIADDWLIEGQRFLNQRFGDDLQFPIYVIRAPAEGDNVFMSISGGAESLWYRDEIADWQGGGYLIRVHKNRSDRVGFNTALLHELSHAFHPFLSTPWPYAIPGMNTPSRPGIQGPSSVYWDHVLHKPDFWRLCFHVWKRATLTGFECRHTRLGLSWVDFDAMREVIENETVELLDLPLWKIARRPIPRRFQQLFDIDLSTLYPSLFMKRNNKSTATEVSVNSLSSESDVERLPSDHSDNTTFNNGENTMSQKFDFDSLVAAEKQTSLDDHAEYQKVLREIARDQCSRSESEILRLLERCGRDTQDLKSDVEWRVKRDTQIAEIKREQEYRDRNKELLAQLRAMREEFENIEAEYNKKRHPIIWESDRLDEKERMISNYRSELYSTCRDPNLELEMEALKSSLNDRIDDNLNKEQDEIRSSIKDLEYQRDNMPISQGWREKKGALSREVKRLEDEHRKIEVKRNEFARKKSEQQAAIDALREKMIYS